MSGNVWLVLSSDQLTAAAAPLLPVMKAALSETIALPGKGNSLRWQIATAPVFSPAGAGHLFVDFSLDIIATADGKPPVRENVPCTAGVGTKDGTLVVDQMAFKSKDKFVVAILNSKEPEIVKSLDAQLATLKLPRKLPLPGVTFKDRAAQIEGDQLGFGAGDLLTDPFGDGQIFVPDFPKPPSDAGMHIMIGPQVLFDMIDQGLDDMRGHPVKKDGATITLSKTEVEVGANNLSVKLGMGGTLEIPIKVGTARFKVSIGTVVLTMKAGVAEDGKRLKLIPTVRVPEVKLSAQNFGARLIGFAVESAAARKIADAIAKEVKSKAMAAAVDSMLPTIVAAIHGYRIEVDMKATDASITGRVGLAFGGEATTSAKPEQAA